MPESFGCTQDRYIEITKEAKGILRQSKSWTLDDVEESIRNIKAPRVDIPELREQLRAAARALEKAANLVPRYFTAVHDHIGAALENTRYQADRLAFRSGGPKKTKAGKPLDTHRKRQAAVEAYVLLQTFGATHRRLAGLLYEAATGKDPDEEGQSLDRACRDQAKFVADHKGSA